RARPNSARIVTARACVSGCCLLMSMRPEAIASFPIWASGLLLAGATAGAILIEPDHCVFRPLDWTSLIDGSHRVELDQYPPTHPCLISLIPVASPSGGERMRIIGTRWPVRLAACAALLLGSARIASAQTI